MRLLRTTLNVQGATVRPIAGETETFNCFCCSPANFQPSKTRSNQNYEFANFFRGKGRNRKTNKASTTDTNHVIKASQSVLLMLIGL